MMIIVNSPAQNLLFNIFECVFGEYSHSESEYFLSLHEQDVYVGKTLGIV